MVLIRETIRHLGWLLVGVIGVAHGVSWGGQQVTEVFCGRGPALGDAEYDAYLARRQAQQAALGYMQVCDAELARIDEVRRLEILGHARHRLVFQPLDLSQSVFSRFDALAEVPSHSLNAEAFALKRYSQVGDGRVVSTLEWQMRRAGGTVRFHGAPRMVDVLGHPARLTRLQAASGESYAALSWVVEGVYLEVAVRAPTPAGAGDRFVMGLAEALTTASLSALR